SSTGIIPSTAIRMQHPKGLEPLGVPAIVELDGGTVVIATPAAGVPPPSLRQPSASDWCTSSRQTGPTASASVPFALLLRHTATTDRISKLGAEAAIDR